LAAPLRGENILASIHYVVGTPCRPRIGFALTLRDHFGDLCDLGREIRFGTQGVVDFFIASFGNVGQKLAKYYHVVVGALKGLRVGFVLFRDLKSLVRTLPKCIPYRVGGDPLLLGKGTVKGTLQRVLKFREVSYERSAISKRIGNDRQCRSAHPLGANQQYRPFTGRVIRHSHLQMPSIADFASSEAWNEGCISESLMSAR
jgi:hypothetical protein